MPSVSSSPSLFLSVAVLLATTSAALVLASTLTVTVYTTSRDCTGTSRTASYASGQCVSAAGASVLYSCNASGALVKSYNDNDVCDGTSFDASIGLSRCSQISPSSSWKFECTSGFCSLPSWVAVVIVVLVSVSMV